MSESESESNDDLRFMQLALDLAAKGQGAVEPNPMVGCVIVRDGKIIGQGHHQLYGSAHAEVNALNSLPANTDARGATAYVTLEPCCHHGKTPPCSQALIDADVARVVVAMQDPFAEVDGGGISQLRAKGIQVDVGLLEQEARELNAPYLKLQRQKRPYVIAKWAMTIDGKIATVSGQSQWITNEESRREVHRLRGRVDAIIVGMGTVRSDDPTLTARPPGSRTATRIVFCQHAVPPVDSNLVKTINQAPLLLIAAPNLEAEIATLTELGAEVFSCSTDEPKAMTAEALDFLGTRRMTNVMLEGGGGLQSSFFLAGLVDECHVYIGGKLFGGHKAPGPVGGGGFSNLSDASAWELSNVETFGGDVQLVYRAK